MQLITPDEVIELAFSPLDSISPESIRPTRIAIATERYVRPAFGDGLFDNLGQPEHGEFVEQYVKPALAHYVRYGMITELAVRVGDSGVVQLSSENVDGSNKINLTGRTSTEETLAKEITKNNTDTRKVTTDNLANNVTDLTVTDSKIVGLVGEKTTNDRDNSDDNTTGGYTETRKEDGIGSPQALIEASREQTNFVNHQRTVIGTDKNKEDTTTKGSSESSKVAQSDLKQTTNTTITVTSSDVDNRENLGSVQRSVDDSRVNTQRRLYERVATESQCRIVAQRALSDANVLLRAALRYIERNPLEFPEYFGPDGARYNVYGTLIF